MPTLTHNKKIAQLNCSTGMYEPKTKILTKKTLATTRITTLSQHEQKQEQTARTPKAGIKAELMLPPLTPVSSEQILTSQVKIMVENVETIKVTTKTEVVTEAAVATTTVYSRDKPLSLSPSKQLQQQQLLTTTTTISVTAAEPTTPTIYLPILATAVKTAQTSRKKCLNIKMPLRHLILTIMAVFFSLEFMSCASSTLQEELTTMPLTNNTHLFTTTINKSTKISGNVQNLPVTSTAMTALKSATSPLLSPSTTNLFASSLLPLSSPSTSLVSPPSISPSLPLQSMESAALIEKLSPTSLLSTVVLDDRSSSVLRPSLSGTDALIHTESSAPTSLQWEIENEDGELPFSTSILNTYDTSDLPPLTEAEQAAKDLLTKGFSIPTYLPPFPVFDVADLPAYLNTVSTTTIESPSNHFRPSDGYDQNLQGNHLYFDNLPNQQLNGQQLQNHRKLQIPNRNSSMTLANVTVQVGNHAYLPCHILRLQNKPVSWVRLRDGHIISVDQTTFIADQRFQAIFQDNKEFTWSLQIKYVQDKDEGWYECQASSEPKMSAKVFLKVIVPLTELIGDQSRFVKAGSKVALHCIVRGTLDPPQYIIWYRDKIQINEGNKMGWYTQLDRNIFGNNGDNQNTIGSLIIPFVRKIDSGNYTCQPSNSASVSVDLHVLSGEYSASAIMSAARTYTLNDSYLLLLLFLLMLLHKT